MYERVPHVTLKSIANNAEIDVIWEKFQETLEPLRRAVEQRARRLLGRVENPPRGRKKAWPEEARNIHADWWKQRIARQQEIDASGRRPRPDYEYALRQTLRGQQEASALPSPLHGLESISPHRVLQR